jgi:hypothetical protein
VSTATPSALLRVLSYAGFFAAIVLVINALKRAEILPLTPVTQLVAPWAQLFSIALILAIFAATPAVRGKIGSVGVVLYVGSLAALVGVEFVINLVFPYVGADAIPGLLAGPLGVAFTVASIAFLTGTVIFLFALWRVPGSPKVAIIVSVLSSVPIALRMAFPELVLQLALGGLAVGIVLLTVWLLRAPRVNAPIDHLVSERVN